MSDTPSIREDLDRMIDSLAAIGLPRADLPPWDFQKSVYTPPDMVYVMAADVGEMLTPAEREKLAGRLVVFASRDLTQEQQEAAVRMFVAKRARPSTQSDTPHEPR